jgi:8-oxo-dGTP pyrophosphatase MutT (NUDIX family)
LKQQFINRLQEVYNQGLPGIEAQLKMVGYSRPTVENIKNSAKNPKLSAVFSLIDLSKTAPIIYLIERQSYKGVHSAQISLPGGKKDFEDPDLLFTAKRELKEEIGVPQNQYSVIGPLTDLYIPPSNFIVQPFLGFTTSTLTLKPEEKEVKQILQADLNQLANNSYSTTKTIPLNNSNASITTPCYEIKGKIVWGATAMILSEIAELLNRM